MSFSWCAVLCCVATLPPRCHTASSSTHTPPTHTQPVLPSWTFQPSALQELWGAAGRAAGDGEDGQQQQYDVDDDAELLDWSVLAPQLSPSLVPLVDGES